jgi:predicted CoA-binding protein
MDIECEFPTINSSKDEIREILKNTTSIAIVGLSPDETKDSHRVAKYLQTVGYKIYPIYPKEDIILGEKVYRSLLDIPHQIDLVDIFRKASMVMEIVDQSIKRTDIKTVWAQKGIINNEAGEKAVANGLKFVQNLCTMVEHKNL